MTIIEELRAKESRDNRDLLDRAADTIEDLQLQLDIAYEQHERNIRESMRNYNMSVDKLHLTYRGLIHDARLAVLEDIKQHAQHPDGRTVYVITEDQLVELYERHGVKHEM